MVRFLVYGLNHKNCPIEIREKLHFRERRLPEAYEWIRREWPSVETLILSTCNRVELYFAIEEGVRFFHPEGELTSSLQSETIASFLAAFHGIERSRFENYVYRLEGEAALEHLFRVTAGLDSMVVGENEILGQVKEAFLKAQEAGTIDSFLYRWVERALKVGKLVRNKTKINEGAVSIPSVAVELAEKIFGKLGGEKVMVIGSGEMSELTLQKLRQAGAEALYIMSRSEERGRALADLFGARWVARGECDKFLEEIDILIASTAAPHPIIKFEEVERVIAKRRHRPLFLIDVGVPRNIEPRINSLDDVYLYNIDDLKEVAQANLKRRQKEVREAEAYVSQAVEEFQAWIQHLQAEPTLERLQNYADELIEDEIARLGEMPEAEREKFRQFAHRLRGKFLHAPMETLKESSRLGTVRRVLEMVHTLFRLGPWQPSEKPEETAEARQEPS